MKWPANTPRYEVVTLLFKSSGHLIVYDGLPPVHLNYYINIFPVILLGGAFQRSLTWFRLPL